MSQETTGGLNGDMPPRDEDTRNPLRADKHTLAPKSLDAIRAIAGTEIRYVVRAKLEPGLEKWCENTLLGVEKNERTAMNNWAKAMGVLGAEMEVNFNLIATKELGMGLSEAKRIIAESSLLEGLDDTDAITQMEVYLRDFYRKRGKRIVVMDEEQAITNGTE